MLQKLHQSPSQISKQNKDNLKANSSKKPHVSLPQSITIRAELTKMSGLERSVEKLLEEDTVMLVTAKKWIIYDMQTNKTIKGFKHKKEHDVASLSKVLTFYTAYMIIQRYYLSIDRLDMMVDEQD
jgi:D-alanyl-D-alanine carboxypeptidase